MITLVWLLTGCEQKTPPFDTAESDPVQETDPADTDGDSDAPVFGIQSAFFAVHLDPTSGPEGPSIDGLPNTERPAANLDVFVDMVELADAWDQKLTLMFTPMWAIYLEGPQCEPPDDGDELPGYLYQGDAYVDCVELVRAFEATGHELAFHHHDLEAPAGWDGFTNTAWEDLTNDEQGEYLGTLDDAQAYYADLSTDSLAGVRAGTTEYFPSDGWLDVTSKNGPAPYEGLADRGDLVSQPCALEENGHTTWKFNMRLFTGASTQAAVLDELDAAIADHAEATEAWTAGFVAHETNFEETGPDNYEALFQRLANDGISLETLSQVALRYEYTGTGAPAGDLPEELACDTDD